MRKISHTELTLMGFFHGQASVHSSDGVNDNLIRRAGADIQIRQKFPRLIDTNPVQRLVGYASASDGRVSSAVVRPPVSQFETNPTRVSQLVISCLL